MPGTDVGPETPRDVPVAPPPPPPTWGETPQAAPERQLRRTTDDKMIFGVAGGLGRYLGVDPIIVRIAFVALAVFGGSGVLLYLLGLVLIPEEKPGDHVAAAGPTAFGPGGNVAAFIGGALVVLGSMSLVGRLVPGLSDLLGPALLVTVGVLVILIGGRR
jgi:phage shock protein C